MGTPKREPQEYSRNIIEYKDPDGYIPILFLLYSWGSLFGFPLKSLYLYVCVCERRLFQIGGRDPQR